MGPDVRSRSVARGRRSELPSRHVSTLYRVIVPVTDLDRAVTFYERVLGVHGERVSGGRHDFDCGGTLLACYQPTRDGDAEALPPLPDHLYLAVDDLRVRLRRVRGVP